ncbi:TRAP transporter large permease subunit [Marinomonas sp. 15G1-11]|uniref:TRAP transporter large permease protein n=1 Tax=Marinomonas phaeophyticola TaxID=3004091 RepID=A0ABT4JRQ1_9GAMM|nr:TRAP transporter large permease subunit [Marinomonas sp. 15G1-11]MCZ2721060.1 TRAP transporter large permease subunit [Marinomonas sp. 15G1-11]
MIELIPIWMFVALFIFVFAGIPVALSLIAIATGFGLVVFGDSLFLQLYGSILHTASNFTLSAIPLFIFMGALLEQTGLALRLFKALQLWMGRFPGGLAVSTITMCAIFAAASGVVGAVEIVVGMMALPAMAKYKYNQSLMAGTVCAGGSLGTIIPPSIVVVVYSSMAQLSIGQLFAASLLPGLIMVVLFILYILITCRINKKMGPASTEADIVPLKEKLQITLSAIIPPMLLITAVLGSLLLGIASPTEAAAVGAAGAALLSLAFRELTVTKFINALRTTINITAMIMLIVMGGTMFTSIFAVSGGGWMITEWVDGLNMGPYGLIFLLMSVVFIAGFVLDWISVVLIFVPIFTPLVNAAGIDPIWFAVMFMVVIQTSYLTPPMAPSIFYLKSIAPKSMTYSHMYKGVMPFVLIQLIVLVIVILIPDVATYLPSLITSR